VRTAIFSLFLACCHTAGVSTLRLVLPDTTLSDALSSKSRVPPPT
jgi:hypothetical protein